MKAKQKYRISQKTLWVAAKKGTYTGYGTTPALAFNHAVKLLTQQKERIESIDGLKNHYEYREQGLNSELVKIRKLNMELKLLVNRGQQDSWSMMAMAFTKTNDAHLMLKKMSGFGVLIGRFEKESAARVQKLIEHWERRLLDGEYGRSNNLTTNANESIVSS
jgi:hypothetical protein